MRFLPFIDGKSFLVVYAIYAAFVIIIAARILKSNNGYSTVSKIGEEKYYVMKYYYNLLHMFYYFTYKLYAKGVLLKDEEDKKFYVNKKTDIELSALEEQVYALYLNKFSPKNFKSKMVKEKDFEEYYYNIYTKLVSDGLIKDTYMINKNRITFSFEIITIIIPGIWRIIGEAVNGIPITLIIPEVTIILFIALVCLYPYLRGRLTNEGVASKEAYENYHMSLSRNSNNNVCDYMDDFLITNYWMLFLGVGSIGTDRNIVYINSGN